MRFSLDQQYIIEDALHIAKNHYRNLAETFDKIPNNIDDDMSALYRDKQTEVEGLAKIMRSNIADQLFDDDWDLIAQLVTEACEKHNESASKIYKKTHDINDIKYNSHAEKVGKLSRILDVLRKWGAN